MDKPNWYAIHSKPNSERMVQEQLRAKGIEVYLPLWQPPYHEGRPVSRRPFFPCYLFAHVELETIGISALHYMPGVRHLVHIAGQPAVVPDAAIERIRTGLARRETRVMDAQGRPLIHGDHVRIMGGPFAGLDGMFDSCLSSEQRVRILMDFIQHQTSVQIDREHIEKMSLAEWAARQVRKR